MKKRHEIHHQENLIGSGVATCGARDDISFTIGGTRGVDCPDCRARIARRIAGERAKPAPSRKPQFEAWISKVINGTVRV